MTTASRGSVLSVGQDDLGKKGDVLRLFSSKLWMFMWLGRKYTIILSKSRLSLFLMVSNGDVPGCPEQTAIARGLSETLKEQTPEKTNDIKHRAGLNTLYSSFSQLRCILFSFGLYPLKGSLLVHGNKVHISFARNRYTIKARQRELQYLSRAIKVGVSRWRISSTLVIEK